MQVAAGNERAASVDEGCRIPFSTGVFRSPTCPERTRHWLSMSPCRGKLDRWHSMLPSLVPPRRLERLLPAPEAGALSSELRGPSQLDYTATGSWLQAAEGPLPQIKPLSTDQRPCGQSRRQRMGSE